MQILSNLRRILYDVSCEEVKGAEENVRNLSEAVEKELLVQVQGKDLCQSSDMSSAIYVMFVI